MGSESQDFVEKAGNKIGRFSSRGIASRQNENDNLVLAKCFEFRWASANVLVPCEHNPLLPSGNRQPFLIGCIGAKSVVMGNIACPKIV